MATPHPKQDLKKTLDAYSAKSGVFRVVDVPPTQYLMADGQGDPNHSPDFAAAVEALYPLSYALKFTSKRELGRDYVVMPLEGLWWAADMASFTDERDKNRWRWTLMIMQPEWITESMALTAIEAANVTGVRFETLSEGRCAQTLHVGSFDDEGPTLATMHNEFIPDNGFTMTGTHHEIYLSDRRRVAPDRMRTILRQPVA